MSVCHLVIGLSMWLSPQSLLERCIRRIDSGTISFLRLEMNLDRKEVTEFSAVKIEDFGMGDIYRIVSIRSLFNFAKLFPEQDDGVRRYCVWVYQTASSLE